jgi:SAM-dependent methyltransferase/uncharacterized protein YbaR (Trm112 family)
LNAAADTPPLDLLRCPACGGTLATAAASFTCAACRENFPSVGGMPWLVPQPAHALSAWRGRCRAMLAQLEGQGATYRAHLTDDVTLAATRTRLKLLAGACDDQARRLRALLAPLLQGDSPTHGATLDALARADSASENPLAYFANAHRDWGWGEVENAAGLAAVQASLTGRAPGRTLVLGAGAGRLAWDLHETGTGAPTIAADINPLLLLVAHRMFAGERLELFEFPLAPRDLASHALLRTLQAPRRARPGLHAVFADARRPPFAPESFDTVVTPRLVDVIDAGFASLAASVNRLLAPGGRWVCTGTLFFQHRDPTLAHATEEVAELVGAAGFARPVFDARRVPYLASPASRHGRSEEVVTFAVTKTGEATERAATGAPGWLEDVRRPVPLSEGVARRALALRVEGYVASLVDGQRSITDIAARLVHERLLLPDEAVGLVQDYLRRLARDA